jgi:uncharacterized membrane protein (UPF0136 family)
VKPELFRVVLGLYTVLMIGGGAAGFAKTKSVPSLAAGLLCGGLAAAGAGLVGRNAVTGVSLGLLGALLAIGGMLPRYLKSHAIWPAGVVTAASIVVFLIAVVVLVGALKARN